MWCEGSREPCESSKQRGETVAGSPIENGFPETGEWLAVSDLRGRVSLPNLII